MIALGFCKLHEESASFDLLIGMSCAYGKGMAVQVGQTPSMNRDGLKPKNKIRAMPGSQVVKLRAPAESSSRCSTQHGSPRANLSGRGGATALIFQSGGLWLQRDQVDDDALGGWH